MSFPAILSNVAFQLCSRGVMVSALATAAICTLGKTARIAGANDATRSAYDAADGKA